MKNKNQIGNRISLVGLAVILLSSMLLEIIKAYRAGGTDAPGTTILLLGIAVLGGGIVFCVIYLCRLLKDYSQTSGKSQDSPPEDAPQ